MAMLAPKSDPATFRDLIGPLRVKDGTLVAAFFCIAAVIINNSAFRLGALPAFWVLLLAASVALVALFAPHTAIACAGRPRLQVYNVAFGALVLAPLSVAFAFSWNRDFPFSGDHYAHVGQVYRLGFWWLSAAGSAVVRLPTTDDIRALLHHPGQVLLSRAFVLLVITATTIYLYRWQRIAALVFLTVLVIVWGLFEQTEVLRYPGGGYLVALPFLGPAFLLGDADLAGRAANVAAPLVWLFVLRPWLVARWPDWRILPVGVLLFWQKDIIYYFNTVYLEPWAVIFSLLAVEVTIVRGAASASLACLLVGAAATVKEPFIIALPFVWLAGAPWRQSIRELLASTGAAIAAGVPFIIYFVARKNLLATSPGDARNLHFGLPDGHIADYAHEFLHRVAVTFPATDGLFLIAALVLIPVVVALEKSRRLQVALLAVAGVMLLLLFVIENDSLGWIGYFRFLLPAFPFLTCGLFAFSYAVGPRVLLGAAVAALLLQAPNMMSAVAQAAGPVTRYNFVENYDAPLFFPIKGLLADAHRQGWLARDATVFAMAPDTSLRPVPGTQVEYAPPGRLVCECSSEHPSVMSLFVRFANLNERFADEPSTGGQFAAPRDRAQLWRATRAARPACLARMRDTCTHVLERVEDGELVAILGLR